MKTQPRQHISNKYNTYTVVTSPVYIGSKMKMIFYRNKCMVIIDRGPVILRAKLHFESLFV